MPIGMKSAALRRRFIIDEIKESHEVRVNRLAKQLRVSEMTVRRDLAVLENEGAVTRVFGGAVQKTSEIAPPLPERAAQNAAEKATVAEIAADLVPAGSSVFIGGGSTAEALARALSHRCRADYATNSIKIAQAVSSDINKDVRLFGGMYRQDTDVLIGAEVLEALERRFFDLAFLGTAAIDPQYGILDPTEWHALLVRQVRQRAKRLCVVADISKLFGSSGFVSLGLDDVDVLVLNKPVPLRFLKELGQTGTEIVSKSAHAQRLRERFAALVHGGGR